MTHISAPNVSQEAQAAFMKNHAQIIALTVARLLAQPGQFDHLGHQAERILSAGFEFTSATLEACMQINQGYLLMDQLRWSKDRLPHDGITMEQLAKNLQVYCAVIDELLAPAWAGEINRMIHEMIAAQEEMLKSDAEPHPPLDLAPFVD